MVEQLHRRFTDEAVKSLLDKYLAKEIKVDYVLEILGIKRKRFFELLKEYREKPADFSIQYTRESINRRISKAIEKNILKEFKVERKMIEDPKIPITRYNYSYMKRLLYDKYAESSFKNIRFKLPTPTINQKVDLRISPDLETGMAEIRFWYRGKLLNTQKLRNDDLNLVHF